MNRVLRLQEAMLELINRQTDDGTRDETLNWERLHMASSARIAWCIALERGADPELSACACTVHDIGRILTGKQAGHAQAGYEPVKEFLQDTGMFSQEETEIIAEAVKNHSSKTVVGTPIEEVVKDADVVDCYQYGLPFDRPEKEERYRAWLKMK